MSRRSRYSSGRGAYVVDMTERVKHWSREWVSPVMTEQQIQHLQQQQQLQNSTASGVASQVDSAAATPKEKETNTTNGGILNGNAFKFKIKTWIKVDDSTYTPVNDGDDDDVLDVSAAEAKVIREEEPAQGSLTAADIRGAVGGEAIPGIVAEYQGDDAKDAKDDKKPDEKQDDSKMEQAPQTEQAQQSETPAEETPAKTSEEPKETKSEPQQPEQEQEKEKDSEAKEEQKSDQPANSEGGDADVDMAQAPPAAE